MASKRRKIAPPPEYPQFLKIDGEHPYKKAIPDGHVPYAARRLRGSEVVFFNYGLAREMGLIPARHPDRMNKKLRRALLDTFSLRIINEYDRTRGVTFPERDILAHTFMATRYLALQHHVLSNPVGNAQELQQICDLFLPAAYMKTKLDSATEYIVQSIDLLNERFDKGEWLW